MAKADRRFAWWLVWSYPPAFRRGVGLGLADALDDRMRARRADGASLIGTRLPAMADTVRNAPIEWIATLRETFQADRVRLKRTLPARPIPEARVTLIPFR